MKIPALILSVLMLSACVTHTGMGASTDGSAVTGERILGAGYMEEYRVAGAGWSCNGSIRASQFEQVSVRTVPLTCTNGATGTAEVTYASTNRAMQVNTNVTVAYTLSNGIMGSVRI